MTERIVQASVMVTASTEPLRFHSFVLIDARTGRKVGGGTLGQTVGPGESVSPGPFTITFGG